MIRFGPSGNSEIFYEQGYNSSLDAPKWLDEMGLDAYEYQCSKGINISNEKARILGERAREFNVFLSIHAPYYINFASIEEEKRENSIEYIMQTARVADIMGASRITIHPGTCAGMDRKSAFETAKSSFEKLMKRLDDEDLGHIAMCPETMGKINQLGDMDEVIELCGVDERIIPTIDFGHLHARGQGCLNSEEDFLNIFERINNKLGNDRLKHFHCHFSKIEYTKGGEKKHWTFAETQFGPDFKPLAKAIVKWKLEPVIISESKGTMAQDALEMRRIYQKEKGDFLE